MESQTYGRYKGFIVDIHPYQLQTGRWCADFDLLQDQGDSLLATGFFGSAAHDSEAEAIEAARITACAKIDSGFSPTLTLEAAR